MEKFYIAKRIESDPEKEMVLDVNQSMKPREIIELYKNKIINKNDHIHNGHWILRVPENENSFLDNNLPKDLKPEHVWEMVKTKIETSDVFVGVIGPKAYGTIAELCYAIKNKKPVYIFPEENLSEQELQDLWFIFQIISENKIFWKDSHFQIINQYIKHINIATSEEYGNFVEKIIPNFMKR